MLPVELRSNFLFGLVILLAMWLVAAVLVKLALAWMSGRVVRYDSEETLMSTKGLQCTREWCNSLLLLSLCIIVVLWGFAFVMTGWVISGSSDDPAGTLEEEPEQPGQLYTSDNNPKVRKEELRQEGDELMKERKETLDDFRKDFFDKRKESETDEKTD